MSAAVASAPRAKIAFVSSVGGHLTDLLALVDAAGDVDRFWVLQDPSPLLPATERAYVVAHAERDLRVAWNFVELAAIFGREKPTLVVTAGAGVAVPAAVVARAAGIGVVYVEPCSSVRRLSLTGRLMRGLATRYFVQWPELRALVPRAEFAGGLL